MPESIRFVAVEVEDIMTVTETMTPRLEAALPSAVDAALHVISEFRN